MAAKKSAVAGLQVPAESMVSVEPAVVEAAGAVDHTVEFVPAAALVAAERQGPVENTERFALAAAEAAESTVAYVGDAAAGRQLAVAHIGNWTFDWSGIGLTSIALSYLAVRTDYLARGNIAEILLGIGDAVKASGVAGLRSLLQMRENPAMKR